MNLSRVQKLSLPRWKESFPLPLSSAASLDSSLLDFLETGLDERRVFCYAIFWPFSVASDGIELTKWSSIIAHSHIHSGTFPSSTKSSSGEPFLVLEMEVSILFLLSWAARAQTRAKKSPLELLFTASTEWDGYASLSVEWSIDDLSYDCLGSARDL